MQDNQPVLVQDQTADDHQEHGKGESEGVGRDQSDEMAAGQNSTHGNGGEAPPARPTAVSWERLWPTAR